jgi:zinc transport system substrate-binding protein
MDGHEADHDEDDHKEDMHSDEEHLDSHDDHDENDEHVDEHHDEEYVEIYHADEHEDEHLHDTHDDEHDHVNEQGTDPHVWLCPTNAQTIVNNVLAGLVAAHPEHAQEFQTNANVLLVELTNLDAAYSVGLASCEKNVIMVTHNAYSYLAADHGFEVISVSGISPESEPSPQDLANLVDEAEFHQLNYIFFEELVSPTVANIIAEEVGAQTLTLNPVAGSAADLGYVAIMNDNLDKLKIGLECQ